MIDLRVTVTCDGWREKSKTGEPIPRCGNEIVDARVSMYEPRTSLATLLSNHKWWKSSGGRYTDRHVCPSCRALMTGRTPAKETAT